MKHITLLLILFLLHFLYKTNRISQTTSYTIQENKNLHFSINATGMNISNYEGSISYSIGQVCYSSNDSPHDYATEGNPHPNVYVDLQNKSELCNKASSSNNDFTI